MGTTMEDSLDIGILVRSIEVIQFLPVAADAKAFAKYKISWEDGKPSSIEDTKYLQLDKIIRYRSHATPPVLHICSKSIHCTEICFLKPLNPNNQLNLSSTSV